MKRLIYVICLLLVSTMLFASCNADNADPHEHSFGTEWASDADNHWHGCTAEGCTEQNEKAAHDFAVETNEEGKPVNVCKVCGATNENVTTAPEHEHVFAEEYSKNDSMHWYACTVENCYETKDKVEHAFGNPEAEYEDGKLTTTSVCVDCGYEKVVTQEIETQVENVTQWNEVFKTFKLTDFSLTVYIGGRENPHSINQCIITDAGVYYCIPGVEEYYVIKNADGTLDGYIKDKDVFKIIAEDDTQQAFEFAGSAASLAVSFADNFEKFTYDAETATYSSNEVIEASTQEENEASRITLYCSKSEVKVVDGKISYISCDYYIDDPEDAHSFTYYNIGISKVEVPQSVIDEAIANGVFED